MHYFVRTQIIISIFIQLFAYVPAECPEPEYVYPCFCEDEDDTLFCNHFYEADQIYRAVKGMQDHKISKMTLFMNRILHPIRKDAFKGLNVQNILIQNSTLTIPSPQFDGMQDYLLSVHLKSCFNKTNPLGTWSLGHLSHLKEFVLDRNRILELPDDWLTSVPSSLKTLTVEENSIVKLGDNVFSKIEHLTFLILDGNRITLLKRSMFPNPAPDLRSISFNGNRLRSLPANLFDEMPQLRILEASNNRFQVLDERPWANVWNRVVKLDVTDNPIECSSSIKWMFESESKPLIIYGECEEPAKLKGKALKKLTWQDLL